MCRQKNHPMYYRDQKTIRHQKNLGPVWTQVQCPGSAPYNWHGVLSDVDKMRGKIGGGCWAHFFSGKTIGNSMDNASPNQVVTGLWMFIFHAR